MSTGILTYLIVFFEVRGEEKIYNNYLIIMKCLTLLYLFGSIIKDTTYFIIYYFYSLLNFKTSVYNYLWIHEFKIYFLYFCNYIHHALPMTSIFKLPWIPNNFMCVFIFLLYICYNASSPNTKLQWTFFHCLKSIKSSIRFFLFSVMEKLWLWWWWAYYLIILIYTSSLFVAVLEVSRSVNY